MNEKFLKFFEGKSDSEIKSELKDVLESLNSTEKKINKEKKNNFVRTFLEFLCNERKIEKFEIFKEIIGEVSITYHEVVQNYLKEFILEVQTISQMKNLNEKIEYFQENSFFQKISLIILLTHKLNHNSQLINNLMIALNIIIDKMQSNKDIQAQLIYFNSILSDNIKCLNGSLLKHIEDELMFNLNQNREETKTNKNILNERNLEILLNSLEILIQTHKEDINFDIIFSKFLKILSLNCYDSPYSFLAEKLKNQISSLIFLIKEFSLKSLQKKTISINFLQIKRKCIKQLDPDFEFNLTFEQRSEKKRIDMERKLKQGKRQAIRKLKGENRLLDVERQKVLKKVETKRLEDIKFTNQFEEQQRAEYKKLVTTQPKQRYKLKKKGLLNKKNK